MNEDDILNQYIKQLFSKEYLKDFQNDSAVVSLNNNTIINVDTIVATRHFFKEDEASSVAHKLVHSNLSDLASMGSFPVYWTFAFNLSNESFLNEKWLEEFCQYIKKLQAQHNFNLIGGDTTFSNELSLTATFFGKVIANKRPLTQARANEGDIICLSNYVGDAFFGLLLLQEKYLRNNNKKLSFLDSASQDYLINKYKYPLAQMELGSYLIDLATSCIDISDGLLKDLNKILKHSNKQGEINLSKMQFSKATKNILDYYNYNEEILLQTITKGDDYQLLFTISKDNLKILRQKLVNKDILIQEIGKITSKYYQEARVIFNNKYVFAEEKGFTHKN